MNEACTSFTKPYTNRLKTHSCHIPLFGSFSRGGHVVVIVVLFIILCIASFDVNKIDVMRC